MKMKKLKHLLTTCTAVAVLAACSTPAPIAAIGFNYEIDNGRANGIVQVFDLSGNTVIQVRDLNQKTTHFLDAENSPISFSVVGENVVLAGIHPVFTISTSTAASRVIRKTSAPAEVTVPVTVPAAGSQIRLAAARETGVANEIARMRKELAELKAMLAVAPAPATSPGAPIIAEAGKGAIREPSVVIVAFPNNSRQFNPPDEQRAQLETLSQSASIISVRGFTDSNSLTAGSAALAKARAEAAKRYLVSMGVPTAKIVVEFDGAGKFIADNRSPAGRAANRRVEIAGS